DIRAATRLLKELCGLKPSERGAKLVFADAGHSLDDRVRHILAHDRGDLDHLLVLGTEPPDPAEEHLVDRVRDRGADCQPTLFSHRPSELLDEERIAIGLGDDEVGESIRDLVYAE